MPKDKVGTRKMGVKAADKGRQEEMRRDRHWVRKAAVVGWPRQWDWARGSGSLPKTRFQMPLNTTQTVHCFRPRADK